MIMDFLFSDKLGSTVFAPVKMDFVGNIKVGVNGENTWLDICFDITYTKLFMSIWIPVFL